RRRSDTETCRGCKISAERGRNSFHQDSGREKIVDPPRCVAISVRSDRTDTVCGARCSSDCLLGKQESRKRKWIYCSPPAIRIRRVRSSEFLEPNLWCAIYAIIRKFLKP